MSNLPQSNFNCPVKREAISDSPSNTASSAGQPSSVNTINHNVAFNIGLKKSAISAMQFDKSTKFLVATRSKNRRLTREKHSYIATVAAKLFMEKGYHQTSMREISNATGMALGNLYDYISKKEDILYLVLNDCYQRRENYLYSESVLSPEDPKESLRLFVTQFLKNKIHFADEMMLVHCESRFLPKENLEEIMKKEIEHINKLEAIVQKGIDQGVFKVSEAYFASCMMINQLSMLAMKRWMFERKYSSEDLATLVEDYILKVLIQPL